MWGLVINWFGELINKLFENPLRNIIILIVSSHIAYVMGEYLFSSFGFLTLLGYVFACINGLTKIVDKPERTLVWGVGFSIGAVAVNMISDTLIPAYDGNSIVSLISVFIIGYVIFSFYLKSRDLKRA
ncbi:MAG: hypothetical protein KAQ92_08560 [Candidatus Aenigmarchaeota archaeon]|nr:hypothetical protein [Candidatus Aenigmarchaeota archaeon]